jgi:hypothetical protein
MSKPMNTSRPLVPTDPSSILACGHPAELKFDVNGTQFIMFALPSRRIGSGVTSEVFEGTLLKSGQSIHPSIHQSCNY